MTKLEELQAHLEQVKNQRSAQVAALIAERKVELELKMLNSKQYEEREISRADDATLDAILSTIESQYADDARKLSHVYGYGVQVNKLLTIAQAIMYSKAEYKADLLMMTNLHEQQVEDIMDSFGSTAYFSPRELCIKPAIKMQIAALKDSLKQMATDIGLVGTLHLAKLNEATVDLIYTKAEVRAKEMLANTLKYAEGETTAYEE